MKFPVRIRRGRKGGRQNLVTIYAKTKSYPFYRVATPVIAGNRKMSSHRTYSEARAAADEMLKDLHEGSPVTGLTVQRTNEAIAAFEYLDALNEEPGRKPVTLRQAMAEYVELVRKCNGHSLDEVVRGFKSNSASIKRVSLATAVKEFTDGREHLTKAQDGKRAQLSTGYHSNVKMWLNEFSETLKNYVAVDLEKKHLAAYFGRFDHLGTRSRNVRRVVLRMFFKWLVRQDYLAAGNRLGEADCMQTEVEEAGATEIFTPKELAALLQGASEPPAEEQPDFRPLLPLIAIGGLAGIRLGEMVRLDWNDVWRLADHIEVSASKSKTRARRLVTVCPALAQWLAPFAERKSGKIWKGSLDAFHSLFGELRSSLKITPRRNGLRHSFCSYHFSLHSNEHLTSALAGNSPAMIHQHYKGLTTKKQGEQWFDVKPVHPVNVVPMKAEGE